MVRVTIANAIAGAILSNVNSIYRRLDRRAPKQVAA